jgi:two-component system sensor histidine kinase YesM
LTRWQWFEMNNLPIRYKLIIHFLLISILPSIGLGILVGWTVERSIEEQVSDNTLQLISKVNKTLESYVGNMQNITYFISFNPDVEAFLDGVNTPPEEGWDEDYDIRKFMQGFTTLYSEVAGILVVNSQGDYISNEMYARTSAVSLTEEAWYQEAVENKGIFKIVGHPSGRNVTTHVNYKDEDVVSVVRAILDPDTQEVKGVVLIDLKLRVIAETLKDVRLGKTGYLTVVDQEGKNIYSPNQPFIDNIPYEWFEQNPAGSFSKKVSGNQLQFIYRASGFTNWTTVGVFSMKESLLQVEEIRFYVNSFVFFVCLIGIAGSFYLSYSISRPIGQLTSFMRKAETGDLTIRYLADRKDEVGILGRSFNKMLAQIAKLLRLTEIQERQKREAELQTLQAHIKPHFLYNTLDTIHWMARKKGAEDVAEVVESLSRLFRIGLSKGETKIPLMEEVEHILSYLKIQKTRYRDKLNFDINISPDVQHLSVLKIILQPIVENAIYHGIKERRGPGHIVIEAEELNGLLKITIEDDGIGIEPAKLEQLQKKLRDSFKKDNELEAVEGIQAAAGKGTAGSGYGILNVQARLQLTFGEAYGLFIDSEQGAGTKVTILHPILHDPAGRSDNI